MPNIATKTMIAAVAAAFIATPALAEFKLDPRFTDADVDRLIELVGIEP